MDQNENKKEYKIKRTHIINLEKFYKVILKLEKTNTKDNDSTHK